LQVRGVSRSFPPTRKRRGRKPVGPVVALDDISFSVEQYETVAVVGPSGCGKSTLLELIAGLQMADSGEISLDGATDPESRRSRSAYMPQRDLLLPWRNAIDNAALALEVQGVPKEEARARAIPLFERFGLAEFEHAAPYELSGGMRQRVAFLRTLLAGRPLLLLDEPFGQLDSITRGQIHDWLAAALEAEPRTVVLVTHDVEEALLLADRVLVLSPRPGRVVADITVDIPRPRPRRQTLTSPEFAALHERALEALGA
jgi:ABC-type nitrate/sulfonate/bicarbonate transport system ATPase subunit